jgi:tetratricopeptide (TPR) repeat protein
MQSSRRLFLTLTALFTLSAALPARGTAQPMSHSNHSGVRMTAAPMFEGLGPYHRAISTKSDLAQRFFDQGMNFMWGFNLQEAQRSFEAATVADPQCAMCQWGVALSLGPHFNIPALPERTVAANAAVQKARRLEAKASPVEKALIEALAKRYASPAPANPDDQKKLDTAYADAMRGVMEQFPDDDDVAALFCEGMMDLRPWDLYTVDGQPNPGTDEIVTTLEKILARNPDHPGANHYYIHAVEPVHPEKAVPSADRLRARNSLIGHMTHMPSHIYERVGRYDEAFEANRRAVEMDSKYEAKAAPIPPESFYPMYAAHDAQFLAATAMTQGRAADAMHYARLSLEKIPVEMFYQMPGFDIFLMTPVLVQARFGQWDDLLKEPAPPPGLDFAAAMWHYGRGLAFAARGKLDAATAELDSLTARGKGLPADALEDINSARALLDIATNVLGGMIAAKREKFDDAIRLLTAAVTGEDQTRYSEPPDWLTPARHQLGAVLLLAGRVTEADAVYREDLRRNPQNGWSLYGLSESLRRQEKDAEGRAVHARFEKAFEHADTKINASSF